MMGSVYGSSYREALPDAPAALPGSERMAARHAQAVVVAMGFLQVAVALLLREHLFPPRSRRVAGPVLALGTLVYAAGYVGLVLWPGQVWLIPCGAAVNLAGFALLAAALSGVTQSLGYLVAATGPFTVGALYDATGGWTWPLALLVVLVLPLFAVAAYVARPMYVEDQLRPRA